MHFQLNKHNVNSEDRTFILSLVLGYKALTFDKLATRLVKYSSKDITFSKNTVRST